MVTTYNICCANGIEFETFVFNNFSDGFDGYKIIGEELIQKRVRGVTYCNHRSKQNYEFDFNDLKSYLMEQTENNRKFTITTNNNIQLSMTTKQGSTQFFSIW